MSDQPACHIPQDSPYRWRGVPEHAYKEADGTFLDVTRRVLCRDEHGQGIEVRYFEVGPGGHTTLERHEHTHIVIPVRGRGRALVHDRVVSLRMHDVIYVPSWQWHQFRADADEALGFLCTVQIDRDRPTLPTPEDLRAFRSDPELAAFIRTALNAVSV